MEWDNPWPGLCYVIEKNDLCNLGFDDRDRVAPSEKSDAQRVVRTLKWWGTAICARRKHNTSRRRLTLSCYEGKIYS